MAIASAGPWGTIHLQDGEAGKASLQVKITRLLLRRLLRTLFRVQVVGLENVPPGPVIACANHLGWAEAFLILAHLPAEPRVYVLGDRSTVLCNAWRTRVIDAFQVLVPVDRGKPREALRLIDDLLCRGGSLLIFPEGHIGEREGALQALQPGAAYLSVQHGIPLLPIGVTGTRELWLRRTITIRIGAPIDPAAVAGNARSRSRTVTEQLRKSLQTLLPGDPARARCKPLRKWLTNLL